jgi:hypothetical protein
MIPTQRQPIYQGGHSAFIQIGGVVLVTFAGAHRQVSLLQVQVGQIQGHHFGSAQTGSLENRTQSGILKTISPSTYQVKGAYKRCS